MRYSRFMTQNHHPYGGIPTFCVAVAYLEMVFRLCTANTPIDRSLLPILLFGIAYGGLGYLLSTLTRSEKANRLITAGLLGLTGLAYIVEFLIHKQFKQFYDLNTMTGGAGDALSGFFADILRLLFPQGGILIVLLMLLPVGVYLLLSSPRLGLVPTRRATAPTRLVSVAVSAVAYGLALLLVLTHPTDRLVYHGQYNFQSAVSQFGLTTGLRLDLQNILFGTGYTFDEPAQSTDAPANSEPESSDPEGSEPEEDAPPVIEYGYNELPLDFAALNKGASAKEKKLNAYVSGLTASRQNAYTGLFKDKNLILITAEAFSAEVIDETLTPTLYRLANKGIQFTDFIQPASAGTTGGEYQNLFGMLPTEGGMSLKNTAKHLNYYTIGNALNRLGYYGKAFHNNTHTYYDRHKTHVNLGYSDGFMGYRNGMENYVKNRWPQSDYEMFSGTLPTYIDKQPFSVYYMTVSGHSGYGRDGNSMTARHWERVQHLSCSDKIKGYLAANLELEDALAYTVKTLEEAGIADDTVICLATDHFPYGLDTKGALGSMPYLSELYGYNVEDYMQRDHSRLILWSGCLEDSDPVVVDTPTFSLDILPTLLNLFGVEFDSRLLPGRDVFSDAEPLVYNTNYDWKTTLGTYYASKGKFVPASEDTVIPEGYVNSIKTTVRNRIAYCAGVLEADYFRHLFGEEE